MNPQHFQNVGGMSAADFQTNPQQTAQPRALDTGIQRHVYQYLQNQGMFSGWQGQVNIQERAIKIHQLISSLRLITPRVDIQQAVQVALSFEEKAFRSSPDKPTYDGECQAKLSRIRDTRAKQAAALQQQNTQNHQNMQAGGMMQQMSQQMLGQGNGQTSSAINPQLQRPMQATPLTTQQQQQQNIVNMNNMNAMNMNMNGMNGMNSMNNMQNMNAMNALNGMGGINNMSNMSNMNNMNMNQHMNMSLTAQQMGLPQQQAFQQALQQQTQQQQPPPQPQPQQQQQQQQQQPQQPQQQQSAPQAPQEKLSEHDNEQINRLAAQMAENTSKDDMDVIRKNLQKMSEQQRNAMMQKGIDPLAYFFRSQALKQFRKQKQAQEGQSRQTAPNPNSLANGSNMMGLNAAQQRQLAGNNMGPGGNPGVPTSGQQNLNGFMGNLDHIRGQQADGLRSQETGELVVPASNPQTINPQHFALQQRLAQQQLSQSGQPNASRSVNSNVANQQHQQQFQNMPQTQQEKMHQLQQQSQAQARAEAAARAQNRISGQPNPLMGQIPPDMAHTSPAMPMLNRPMGPQASDPNGTAPQRPPSRAPGSGQQGPNPAVLAQMQQRLQQSQGGQIGQAMQRPPAPTNPEQLKQMLSQLPPDQARSMLDNWRRQQAVTNAMRVANAQQHNVPMQQTMSQPGQLSHARVGQFPGEAMNVPTPMQQSLSASNNQGQGPSQQTQQQMFMQQHAQPQQLQQSSQQQQQVTREELLRRRQLQLQHQQRADLELTDEQMTEMDKVAYPPQIMNTNPSVSQPKNVKTWGQLKHWASQNQSPGQHFGLSKMLALQKMHYSQLLANGRAPGQVGQNRQIGAPQAQFATSQPPGPTVQQAPGAASRPIQVPNVEQMAARIGPQELHDARGKLPEHMKHLSDQELRGVLVKSHHSRIIKMQQAQQAQQQQQQQQIAAARANKAQQQGGMINPASQPQGQGPQASQQFLTQQGLPPGLVPEQLQPSTVPQFQTQPGQVMEMQKPPNPQGTHGSHPTQPQQQSGASQLLRGNLKRSNSDEVVEVPNPNSTLGLQTQQPQQTGPQPHRPNIPRITPEQLAKMTPEQRQQFIMLQNRTRPASQNPKDQAQFNRFKQLLGEEAGAFGARPLQPVPMNPETRADMVQKLTDKKNRDMFSRIEGLMLQYHKLTGDEAATRELIRQRLHLIAQFVGNSVQNKEFKPIAQFTISVDYLNSAIYNLQMKFQQMMDKLNQLKLQSSQQSGGDNLPPATSATTATVHPLNAMNLKQLQQQEETRRRSQAQSNAQIPAAPTTGQPPFAIPGAASPSGTPQYPQLPPALTQKELKLPPSKKRKPNQQGSAASTPAQAQGTPGPSSSPQLIKTVPIPAKKSAEFGAFKCPVSDCHHHKDGFKTDIELVQHVTQAHKPKEEVIEDALAFALSGLAQSFGLDEHGKPKSPPEGTGSSKPTHVAPPMQATGSRQGGTPAIKGEGTPATGVTPMARGHSQFGGKSMSPGSNVVKDAQTTGAKATSGKAVASAPKTEGPKRVEDMTMEDTLMVKDPWDDSPVSFSAIRDTFGAADPGFAAIDSNGMDELLAAWVSSDAYTSSLPDFGAEYEEAFSTIQPSAARSSSDSSHSPGKSSDVSKAGGPSVPVERTSSQESWIDVVKEKSTEKPVEVVGDGIEQIDLGNDMHWMIQDDEPWQELDWEKLVAEDQVE